MPEADDPRAHGPYDEEHKKSKLSRWQRKIYDTILI
jgi:hypothetical protein